MRRVLVATVAALLTFAGAAPATADEDEDEKYVDLFVTSSFDYEAYTEGNAVTMTVTIRNNGTIPATGVVVHSTGDLSFTDWGGLDEAGPGVTLPPDGKEQMVVVTAPLPDDAVDVTQVVEAVAAEPDRNPADNKASDDAFLTAKKCDLTLTLHTDNDGDGVLEPGETTRGVWVKLIGGLANESVDARTDDHGVVRFPNITGGVYRIETNLRTDWYIDPDEMIRLRPGQNDVVVRARPVDLSKVVASVALDRDSYAVGDTVRERVTITNNGTMDVLGLIAKCSTYNIEGSGENELSSVGWGELDGDLPNPGATVRAGETRVWEFTSEITPRMWDYGSVILACDFVLNGTRKGVYAMDRAAVPGGYGTFGGQAYAGADHEPVSGVELVMISKHTGAFAARVTTDRTGQFTFPEMSTGAYELRPIGRWRLADEGMVVTVLAGFHRVIGLELQPGPLYDPDGRPQSPLESPRDNPAPQASPAPHPANLAHTGADVIDLLAFGALLMVVGALLLRRRSWS
jgi:LPXTG-motif cell wall-anchored protein